MTEQMGGKPVASVFRDVLARLDFSSVTTTLQPGNTQILFKYNLSIAVQDCLPTQQNVGSSFYNHNKIIVTKICKPW